MGSFKNTRIWLLVWLTVSLVMASTLPYPLVQKVGSIILFAAVLHSAATGRVAAWLKGWDLLEGVEV